MIQEGRSTSEANERFRMYTDFHVWEINVSTTLLSIQNNRSHICHALSFEKHLLTICASERSESSCIFISQERTYVTSNVRFISQYTLFFEQYRYHLQVDVKAKISLCGPLINYFGISLLSLILTFSSHFSHCHYHVIVEVMFLLRL